MDNGSQHTSEPSVAALLGGIVNDVKDLLVQELVLTKLEVQDTLRKAKTAAIALGIGIGVVAIGGMLLMLMLVQVLAQRQLQHAKPERPRFVEAMMTVVASLKQQHRNVLNYMTAACKAALRGEAPTSLLPTTGHLSSSSCVPLRSSTNR